MNDIRERMEQDLNQVKIPWSDWKIVRHLGGGGYGQVYEAVKSDFGVQRQAAIKIINVHPRQEEIQTFRRNGKSEQMIRSIYQERIKRFGPEMKIMESLKGLQNIVSIEDFKIDWHRDNLGLTIYIRMELLIPFTMIAKRREFSEKEIIKLGCDICSALEFCEKSNIIHRDIKLDNIFVNRFGDYKLGDFGISNSRYNLMGENQIIGTPAYMAPELFNNGSYNNTTDIYSLGIGLYYLLNNNTFPFLDPQKKNHSDLEKITAKNRRIQGETLEAPVHASERMTEIILKSCAPRPEDRYTSASEMKKDLMELAMQDDKNWNWGQIAGIVAAVIIGAAVLFGTGYGGYHLLSSVMKEGSGTSESGSDDPENIMIYQIEEGHSQGH